MEKCSRIKLNREDVEKFVHTASKCDFDIDVRYNRIVVDAKSMLGVFSLDLSHVLTVEYSGENEEFEKLLGTYAAKQQVA